MRKRAIVKVVRTHKKFIKTGPLCPAYAAGRDFLSMLYAGSAHNAGRRSRGGESFEERSVCRTPGRYLLARTGGAAPPNLGTSLRVSGCWLRLRSSSGLARAYGSAPPFFDGRRGPKGSLRKCNTAQQP